MATGFQMDGINFTADGLANSPDHSAIIGEIVTPFSLIEGVIGGIYGMLRHKTIDLAIEELRELSTNAKRIQAVRQAIKTNSLLAVDPQHDELMKRVMTYAESRNKVAHGVWGAHPDQLKIVYRLPMKKWINFIARSVAAGTEGTFIKEIDELKVHLGIYDITTLASLKAEGDDLLKSVLQLFTALAQINALGDGWIRSVKQR